MLLCWGTCPQRTRVGCTEVTSAKGESFVVVFIAGLWPSMRAGVKLYRGISFVLCMEQEVEAMVIMCEDRWLVFLMYWCA